MKYILITIISIIIAYFLLCNRIHTKEKITQYTKPEIVKLNDKTYQTTITENKSQKSDLKIKVKSKKTITKTFTLKDSNNVIKINDSTYSLRIEQIDSISFTLKDNNIKVIVQDTNTKIIDLIASKKPKRNYNKVYFISGIITTILVIFLVK